MSKRSRGPARPTAHRRPGTRPGMSRPARSRASLDTVSQLEAAPDIAEDIVENRPAEAARELEAIARTQSHQRHRTAKPGSLRLVPPDARLADLNADYDKMKLMIFDEPPSFASLIGRLRKLEEEINATEKR